MKIVIALGGNALGNTPVEQLNIVKNTASHLADLIGAGNEVIITHGNGPQVGMINLAFDVASENDSNVPQMPFPECGSMSQGYIGYHLQNALQAELKRRSIDKCVAAIVTQVVVDKNDPAFFAPTKPIGAYYSKETAEKLSAEKGFTMAYIENKGYRRVVASPKPIDIEEKQAINTLVSGGCVVITVGGGGIPVVREGDELKGVAAVIDKDYASAKVAELIDADMLVILTAVNKVAINFGKPNQEDLSEISVKRALELAEEGHFGKGSMFPKVMAAVSFVKSEGKSALIASLGGIKDAIEGKDGTKIVFK
ncbi:MAG: carbamate kinase [Clostridia bacterium]|nr:carbamate kinase [Clostridia bacterium]